MTTELAQVRHLLSEQDDARMSGPVGQQAAPPMVPPQPASMMPGFAPPTYAPPFYPQQGPQWIGPPPPQQPMPPVPTPRPARPPRPPRPPRSSSQIIGRILAALGVGVTLIGVVLLLVLAAQAGLLRPELRVAGGAVFAAALLGAGVLVSRRRGGRVGGISLAATGIAAGYIDVMAASVIYHWLPAAVALIIAGVIAGAGLGISRWWSSEWLGVAVMVPLLVLAPIITGGVDFSLIAFMLVLSAAALWVPIGRDWLGFYAARTAVSTIPLALGPLAAQGRLTGDQLALLLSCAALNALLAVGSALIVLRPTRFRLALGVISGVGAVPLALSAAIVDPRICAAVIAGYALIMVGLGAFGARLPGVTLAVRIVWFATAALACVVALPMAFEQTVVVPALLAVAFGLAGASLITPSDAEAAAFATMMRVVAAAVGALGSLGLLALCPPWDLIVAPDIAVGQSLSVIIASLLALAATVTLAASVQRATSSADTGRLVWAIAAVAAVYQCTQIAVHIGILAGGRDGGFLGGHMAATIGWVVVAAALLGYATRIRGTTRALLVGAGLALTAAAVGKLFLFDLATLDGLFRVIAFIVVGLVLLALGAGYARLLDNADDTAPPRQ